MSQTRLTSSKIFSKMVNHFLQKSSNFVPVYFVPYDFVQISPACGPNTYQIMYGETLTSIVSISNGNIKCPLSKLPLKLYHATVAKADTGSLKSLCTLFDTYLDNILAQFEPNRMVPYFEFFDKKQSFLKPFLIELQMLQH